MWTNYDRTNRIRRIGIHIFLLQGKDKQNFYNSRFMQMKCFLSKIVRWEDKRWFDQKAKTSLICKQRVQIVVSEANRDG